MLMSDGETINELNESGCDCLVSIRLEVVVIITIEMGDGDEGALGRMML